MQSPPKRRQRPEAELQKRIIEFLEQRDWVVIICHASQIFKGVPDLYVCHKNYGVRWVEVKVAGKYKFTKDQLRSFPVMHSNGAPIYILTDATEEQYSKLFEVADFPKYLRNFEKERILKMIGDNPRWDRELILGEDYE